MTVTPEQPETPTSVGSIDGWLGLILGTASLVAAGYAAWLTRVKLQAQYSCDANVFNSCGGEGSPCHTVFSSPWSEFAGLPVTIFATAFYVSLLVLGLIWTAKAEWLPTFYRPTLLVAALLDVAVSIVMVTYAEIELGAFCTYCAGLYLASLVLLAIAAAASDRSFTEAVPSALGLGWISNDSGKLLLGLAAVFLGAVWVQIGIYDGAKANSFAQDCSVTLLAPLPPSRITLGDGSAPIRVAEFINPSCPNCGSQSTNMEQWLPHELSKLQLNVYLYPRDSDTRCCAGCSSAEGNSTHAQSCLAALTLQCLALEPGGNDKATKVMRRIWLELELFGHPTEGASGGPLFSEAKLAKWVGEELGMTLVASAALVERCINNTVVQSEVQAHVTAGDKVWQVIPVEPSKAGKKVTPFALLFSRVDGVARNGTPDFLVGEKPLATWLNRQERLTDTSR